MKGKPMPMLLILLEDEVGCWFENPDTGGPEIKKITNQQHETIKQPPIKDKCFQQILQIIMNSRIHVQYFQGLSHEMDLALENMHGQFQALTGEF